MYARSGTKWTQRAYIKASNTDAGDSFGYSLALSADGNTLAVGASREDSLTTGVSGNPNYNFSCGTFGTTAAGAVYVFSRSNTTWTQQAYIKASNTDANDNFGDTIALSSDGRIVAVGAQGERSSSTAINGNQLDNSGTNLGAVYVFSSLAPTLSPTTSVPTSAPTRSPTVIGATITPTFAPTNGAPSPIAPTTSPSSTTTPDALPLGAIIGGAVGGLLLIGAGIVLVVCLLRRQQAMGQVQSAQSSVPIPDIIDNDAL